LSDRLSAEEAQELLEGGIEPPSNASSESPIESAFGAVKVIPIPATLWIKYGDNVAGFDASAAESFAYTPLGVFATGRWLMTENESEIEDVLIPYAQIHHFEFHFPAELVEEVAEEQDKPAKETAETDGKDTSD
jgi:hypothetical protein